MLLFFKREQVNIDIQDAKNMRKRDTSILCMWIRKLYHLCVCVNANRDIDEKERRSSGREAEKEKWKMNMS